MPPLGCKELRSVLACCFTRQKSSVPPSGRAPYVIDGLMHNDVVKSDVHSTDTHGYSEMIFGTMHLLGFSYAPRIKNLKHQRLYTFKSRRGWDRAQAKVAPSGYIDTQIIEVPSAENLRQDC